MERDCRESVGVAVAYSIGVSIAFVGSLYLFVPSRIRSLSRDDPLQIKWRSGAVAIACWVSWVAYPFQGCRSIPTLLSTEELGSVALVLLQTMSLYLGSLVALILEEVGHLRGWQRLSIGSLCRCVAFRLIGPPSWIIFRNLLFAPLVEEWVFRACIVSALAATDWSRRGVVLTAPLFFGVAHVHHGFMQWRRGVPGSTALVQTLFQFTYTTLFGVYTSYVYYQTGSFAAIALSHAFCNMMGVPNVTLSSPWLSLAHVGGFVLFVGMFRFV